ncbi:hypothetical protein [Altererythrobacter sp. TH136]|uniref:hypothetical protein n=1 Tax=Altererythrobacter sp. TH136 TaxID=2067415 RepID=UPI0011629BE3|nr:hypothetical protein [Altererythrobacter sp. TH136]QDM41001.1 hypothetical protein C0V74_08145 [Altererythrobacter sp. TH136]
METALSLVATLGSSLASIKGGLEASLPFNDDTLHVLVGVVLQLCAAAALRTSIATLRPWLIVLALEMANEANDAIQNLDRWGVVWWRECTVDIALTMALPTLLYLLLSRGSYVVASSSDDRDGADCPTLEDHSLDRADLSCGHLA